ncbi:hypothetical protein [Streptomyces rimosus]|uniref:hypothetical protein n=1 Tax=Streptomyces rimosus TaxID=1927 RepID=UPI0013317F95|nr:hypothetical protein [Streptomyces rimosus]
MAVLHRKRDPAAGLAVDEPGDGAAKTAQSDGAVGIGRDQLMGPVVGGGELVGPSKRPRANQDAQSTLL